MIPNFKSMLHGTYSKTSWGDGLKDELDELQRDLQRIAVERPFNSCFFLYPSAASSPRATISLSHEKLPDTRDKLQVEIESQLSRYDLNPIFDILGSYNFDNAKEIRNDSKNNDYNSHGDIKSTQTMPKIEMF